MSNQILKLVHNIKRNNISDTERLLQLFHPLLKSLSIKLDYEDTYQDLSLFLVNLIPKIPSNINDDKTLLSYIKVSLRHELFRLSKIKKYKSIEISTLNIDENIAYTDTLFTEIENKIVLNHIIENLSLEDKRFVLELLSQKRTVKELSIKYNVTTQSIYQRYYKLIKKLKGKYD